MTGIHISIIGLGYVGVVTGACLADAGHTIVAVDIDRRKVDSINAGHAPVIEPELAKLIARNVLAGRLRATTSYAEAIASSDITLICVGTPGDAAGVQNLDSVTAACRQVGAALAEKGAFHSVVLRSTVLPGTARTVAIPELEKASGKKAGTDFGFGNNPEFLREGAAVRDFRNPPKIVIGAVDEATAVMIGRMYEGIDAPRAITTIDVAEGVKYADNAWHAMKVGFANEMGNVLKVHGVDSHEVMDIFCLDTKLNISSAYLKPGFAFGGSCLPKDLQAIRASAQTRGLETPLFDSLLLSNAQHVRRGYEMIRSIGKRRVGMMGLAFKAGTDDLRGSPLVQLATMLVEDGIDLSIYDPSVYAAARGMDIPHLARCLVAKPEELVAHAELFVI